MNDTNKNHNKHRKIYLEIAILLIVIIVAFIVSMLITLNKKPQENLANSENISNTENTNNNKSSGINKITAIDYNSSLENPTTYIVVEPEKIEKIAKLLANANWKNADIKLIEITDRYHYNWYIKIEGTTEAEFFMYGVPVVKIKTNNEEKVYEIKEDEYKEILASFNIRYYLHKSDIEEPTKERIVELQNQIFKNLSKKEIEEVQNTIRTAHVYMEYLLIDAVNLIKDPNSPYWEQYNNGGSYKDAITGVAVDVLDYCFNTRLQELVKIKNIIKDEEIKKEFEKIIQEFENAMNNHELASCFKVHEFIHDYDYYAINYPAYYPTFPPADWEGIGVYFGHLKLN